MNTCAECRFWDRASTGERKTCTLLSDDEDAVILSSDHSRKTAHNPFAKLIAIDDEGGVLLFTRSDFGCVQFEAIPATVPHTKDDIIKAALEEAIEWMPDPDEDTRLMNRDEARAAIARVRAAIQLAK